MPCVPQGRARTGGASLHDLTCGELEALMAQEDVRPAQARRLFAEIHREAAADMAALLEVSDFQPPLRKWLQRRAAEGWYLDHPEVAEETGSSDALTRKFLLRMEDRQRIETVAMSYDGRHTACVSTQAGCAMGCVFCATGQMGFVRNLRPGEIVAQVHHVRRHLRARGAGLRNLVLMGMGEPMQNYDAVLQALRILTDTRGARLGAGHISVSTVGVVPGILRLAEEPLKVNLAVSLHGADEAERAALVPVSRRWPLADVLDACRKYQVRTGRRIFFAWTLIRGVNDTPGHAEKLGALLAGMDAHVNLIPLNRTGGYSGEESGTAASDTFQAILRRHSIPSTMRQPRGLDVAAGCGQLKAPKRERGAHLVRE